MRHESTGCVIQPKLLHPWLPSSSTCSITTYSSTLVCNSYTKSCFIHMYLKQAGGGILLYNTCIACIIVFTICGYCLKNIVSYFACPHAQLSSWCSSKRKQGIIPLPREDSCMMNKILSHTMCWFREDRAPAKWSVLITSCPIQIFVISVDITLTSCHNFSSNKSLC